jgi:hypothetical protein
MATGEFSDMNEDDLRRSFLILGCKFFQLDSNPTALNVQRHLSEHVETLEQRAKEATDIIESLRDTVKKASDSSTTLASALNWLTLALVIVGLLTVIMQAVSIWAK